MPRITADTPLVELATIVSEALHGAGIVATLSGGSAVSVYSDNRYRSADLDFVTTALRDELAAALEPLGFAATGSPRLSVFTHPDMEWYLEFPPAPLAFGGRYVDVSESALLATPAGDLRIITPTQCVMDRLIAASSWNDPQALEQAVLVATHQADSIDWQELEQWLREEGIAGDRSVIELYRAVGRASP